MNKKAIKKSLIILSLIIIIIIAIIQIGKTLARYESATATERDVDIAFWIVDNSFQTERLLIKDIYPREVTEEIPPFEYKFSVSNFNSAGKKAETDLDYEIELITTTNLPLSYKIKKNGNTCTVIEELFQDEDGTFYKRIKLETDDNQLVMSHKDKMTDSFVLEVTFPKENSRYMEYADLIEDIKVNLSAKQVIEE